jgi:hypothetical protein
MIQKKKKKKKRRKKREGGRSRWQFTKTISASIPKKEAGTPKKKQWIPPCLIPNRYSTESDILGK